MRSRFEQAVRARATRAGVVFTEEQLDQLSRYWQLLARWNRRINLTALPLDGYPDASIDRLLLEPVVAARHVPGGDTPWIDVGSGGGSPAIPLKLMRPAVPLMMVESRERKAAFLREAMRHLGLEKAAVHTGRFEALPAADATFGLITLRAVKLDQPILRTVARLLSKSGVVLIFGASGSDVSRSAELAGVFRREPDVVLPGDDARLFRFTRV